MKILTSRLVWGLLLIFGGVVFLLENLGIIAIADAFWGVIFLLGGLAFLSVYLANRTNWWALIPGIILIDLAVLIGLSVFFEDFSEQWGGALFLGGIGLAFFIVYLANPSNWWAVIPGGVLLTLAVVAGIEDLVALETGGIFFLGLGLTFALVALVPTPSGRMSWAWIPAGVLIVMGLLVTAAAGHLINYIWPAALILAGLFLLFRTFFPRRNM